MPTAVPICLICIVSGHSKTCVKRPVLKIPLNAGQKYCRMLQTEHSAILSTFIKLPFVIRTFVLFFEWPFTQVLLYVFFIYGPRENVYASDVGFLAIGDSAFSAAQHARARIRSNRASVYFGTIAEGWADLL